MENTGTPEVNSALMEENRRLRLAVEELSVLNEITTVITSTQPMEEIVNTIVQKCVKHLKVEQGAIMMLDEKDEINPFHTMIRNQDSISRIIPYRLDTQLTGWMLKNKTPLLVNDLSADSRFNFSLADDFPIRSLLSVPLKVKGKMIGLLSVFNKKSESGFTKDDQRLLGIIASQSGQLLENARLYIEEQSLLLLQEEMRLAYDIQVDLLPKKQPVLHGYKIAGKSIPAKDVGGDFFDFIDINSNQLAFCIADISGKGMPAALLMANLQATLRGQTMMKSSCSECVSFANEILYHNSAPNKFATLFYAILDTEKNDMIFCNAGHNNPYLISNKNKITELSEGGLIVGIMPSVIYNETSMQINPGDLIVLFSDGITEAMNINEEELNEERLKNIILNNKHEEPEALINKIFNEVNNFTGNIPRSDDMTLVVVKRNEE